MIDRAQAVFSPLFASVTFVFGAMAGSLIELQKQAVRHPAHDGARFGPHHEWHVVCLQVIRPQSPMTMRLVFG